MHKSVLLILKPNHSDCSWPNYSDILLEIDRTVCHQWTLESNGNELSLQQNDWEHSVSDV